jgi:hypothetical protein
VTPPPCDACPWSAKGQPDLTDELRARAAAGNWFCCHVKLGTCWGVARYQQALASRDIEPLKSGQE